MAELITDEAAERTARLARTLLPRPCPTCELPVIFPRREASAGTGGNYLCCDPLPTDTGTVTLRDRGPGVGVRATIHARVYRGYPALQLHRCAGRAAAADAPPPVSGTAASPWWRPRPRRAPRR